MSFVVGTIIAKFSVGHMNINTARQFDSLKFWVNNSQSLMNREKPMKVLHLIFIVAIASVLGACQNFVSKQLEWETIEPQTYPVIRSIGYAPIDAQSGQTRSAKMLNALKASKLDAYRELTEQVYGQKIDGGQSLANLVLTNTQLKATVQGVIRGARVVKSYPVGTDSYATELELDFALVHDIYLTTAKPKRVKKVRYY